MSGGRPLPSLLVAVCFLTACTSDDSGRSAGSEGAPTGRTGVTSTQATVESSSGASASRPVRVETDPVPHGGDAADDPAIWIDQEDPARSTIIGTDKLGGIAVYDLAGRQIQYRPDGRLNNVDIRNGFELAGETVSLVTAGDREDDSIAVYRVDPATRELVPVAARRISVGISSYGSCMYHSTRTGRFFYFVNSKDGEVEQWELIPLSSGSVDAHRVRSFDVGSQTEGCVADDERGILYIGEEEVGIWEYGAEPDSGTARDLVDPVAPEGHLEADVEGLAIAYTGRKTGYLLASSQGDSSFVVYARESGAYVAKFRIEERNGVDAVQDTDGIDVTTANLGSAFPHGVFVAQDGKNDSGNQNYKLVPLEEIPLG